jgi:glycosyltransferase involved in cell wall biosynthesis
VRILYLNQYFITRTGVGGTRAYEFARYFVEREHEVTVVTAAPAARKKTGVFSRESVAGIDVLKVHAGHIEYSGSGTRMRYISRIVRFFQFALASSWAVIREKKPDVIFASSTPLTIGIPALIASKWHRRPLVFEVRDLWPEAPIQMGALRNPLVIKLAKWLERTIYRGSAHIVALSPGMKDGILSAGVPPSRVTMIPNASDLELFSPGIDGNEFRGRLGLTRKFVCSYFGTMGAANDLMQVVEAARLLQERGEADILFLLHGDGKQRSALEAFCREHSLNNVIFSQPIADKNAVATLAAASDVCMTIYKNVPILYTCSPNKLFDTFAAGRPAVVNCPGWLQELVEQNQAGVYVRPDDPNHLAEQVVFLYRNPDLVRLYGHNARVLAERVFDRKKLANELLTVLHCASVLK